ncbi:Phosphoglycerate dehydrogenase [Treponema bryantii]|uniref:Phosphoglycerate dehydrogenase n=1 Tax=Treponema bryantii TaxID=163 RepID=A0A1I3HTZ7_9SPIR|nr:D-2-hydroxyacid dehydrogenase [Treponema bryantii]SFI39069.1 Phosphoglycerate dehydrogenase [Treponema bryantii]
MKILVINNMLEQKHLDLIKTSAESLGHEVFFYTAEAEIPQTNYDADIIYGFAPSIVKTSKTLKWLCVPWAGVDSLMVPGYFANEDCLLTNAAGAYGVSIAEHMIAVSLVMMRRLDEFLEETRGGQWLKPRAQRSLKDCRITVLGTGDIGTTFANRAKAFEPASFIGVCRSGKSSAQVYDKVLPVSELDSVLPETDLLAMSLPATPETRGILSRKRLALLPEGAYIVNVGRGSAIDEEALADALDSGHLAGAALDVFQTEPLPKGNRLWKTKKLVITPHVAGNMTLPYTKDKNVQMFLEDLKNFTEGKELRYLVDKKLGY